MTQHPSVSLANIGVGMPGCFVSKSYDGGRAGAALRNVANLKLRLSRFAAAFPSLKTLCDWIPCALAMLSPIDITFDRQLFYERAALYVIAIRRERPNTARAPPTRGLELTAEVAVEHRRGAEPSREQQGVAGDHAHPHPARALVQTFGVVAGGVEH